MSKRSVVLNGREYSRSMVLDYAATAYAVAAFRHSGRLTTTPEGVVVSLPGSGLPNVIINTKTLNEFKTSARWFCREFAGGARKRYPAIINKPNLHH